MFSSRCCFSRGGRGLGRGGGGALVFFSCAENELAPARLYCNCETIGHPTPFPPKAAVFVRRRTLLFAKTSGVCTQK